MAEVVIREALRATDAQQVSEAVRSVLGEVRIEAGVGALLYQQLSLLDDGVSVTRVRSSGAPLRLVGLSTPDLVVVAVREGRLELVRGTDRTGIEAGGIGLLPLVTQITVDWDAVVLDAFAFPVSTVGQLLGRSASPRGSTPVRPVRLHAPLLVPQEPKLTALWLRLAGLVLTQVLEESDLYQRDLVREQLVQALLGATIEAFELSDAAEDEPGGEAALLRRAEVFMTEHVGDPVSMPEVARAALVSLRGLQLAYRRHSEVTPVVRLRQLRLAAARDQLRHGDGSTTVGAVARRCGYSNLGRFSAHYRESYGESPLTTLNTARGRTDPRGPDPVDPSPAPGAVGPPA